MTCYSSNNGLVGRVRKVLPDAGEDRLWSCAAAAPVPCTKLHNNLTERRCSLRMISLNSRRRKHQRTGAVLGRGAERTRSLVDEGHLAEMRARSQVGDEGPVLVQANLALEQE